MKREQALKFIKEKTSDNNLLLHMFATEAVMKALAKRLGENSDLWGLAGLVHDCDRDLTIENVSRHGKMGAEMLREAGVEESVCYAVERHPGFEGNMPQTSFEIALRAADQASGLITASALINPSKSLKALKVKSIKKRMKDKRFAAGIDRDAIKTCEKLDLQLDEFLEISVHAMEEIADLLQLDGRLAQK